MQNSIVLLVTLSLLTLVEAGFLGRHAGLHEKKIDGVLPRDNNENEKQNGKDRQNLFDAQEIAAFESVRSLDTGEPCDHATTVVVTQTAVDRVAAIETIFDSNNSRNKTGNGGQRIDQNQNQNDSNRGHDEEADTDKKSGGERGQGGQTGHGKGQGGQAEFLTLTLDANNNGNRNKSNIGNGQGNDQTITVTKTEIAKNANINNGSERTQLLFVTKSVFGDGNAPTVTLTTIADVITQRITITEDRTVTGDIATVTLNAPPTTVTVTEAGIRITTNVLAGAPPTNIVQSTAILAPSEVTAAKPSDVAVAEAPYTVSNGVGVINAAGFCECHCQCGSQDFPTPVRFAFPDIGAAQAIPVTTLQMVVSFASQSVPTAFVALDTSRDPSQVGAGGANSPVSTVDSAPNTATDVNASLLDNTASQPTTTTAGESSDILTAGSAIQDTATQDIAAQNTVAATVDEPSQPTLSGSQGGVFVENPPVPTMTPDIPVESTTTARPDSITTNGPPVPSALADNNGAPVPININTYSLASAVALGHLRRR